MKINFSDILSILGIIIAVAFIVTGIIIMLPWFFDYIPLNYRLVFGAIMIAYGGFRLVSIYFKQNSSQDVE